MTRSTDAALIAQMGAGGGGGGGGADNTKIPAAHQTGYTIDTTTYTDPITGTGKIQTAVFPSDVTAIGIAIAGDTHPRWVIASDGSTGIYCGDGTSDPVNHGANFFANDAGGGNFAATLYGNGAQFDVGQSSSHYGKYAYSHRPLVIQSVAIQAGSGDPNGSFGGDVGGIYIDRIGSPLASSGTGVLWQCTTAGTSGTAAWIALV